MNEPESTTLSDDEIVTTPLGASLSAAGDDTGDTGDTSDTGDDSGADDSGDTGDVSDTGDDAA